MAPVTRRGPSARTMALWFSVVLLAVAAIPSSVLAARGLKGILEDRDAQWQITADRLSYLEREGVYIAEGDVAVTRSGQALYAQKGVYNEKTGIIEVSGDVRFETNGDYLTGEHGVFDLNTRTGRISGGRLFMKENHFYVDGSSMEKLGAETYLVKDARITSCDDPDAAWSITASRVKVTIEGYGVVKNPVFRIRGVPVLYLPYGVFPAKTRRQSGVLPPGFGYSSRNGAEVEIPIFWAAADQADATFYERYMSERGLMQGLEGRYVAEQDSKGVFLFDILSDRIGEKDLGDTKQADVSPFERTNSTRYWFRGKADQALPLGAKARLDADYVSDQDYLREFSTGGGFMGQRGRPNLVYQFGRPMEDIQSPLRSSRLRLDRDRESYSLQAYSSYYQRQVGRPDDTTPQPLAGAFYSLLPRPLFGGPLFVRFLSEYTTVWRERGDSGQRVVVGPEVASPFPLGPHVVFEPSVSFTRTAQFYAREGGGSDDQLRDAYELQTRLSTLLERTYDTDWGETKRLKHKVLPSFVYRYRGYRDGDKYRPWFEPVDAEGRRNVVALSLENFLDARNEDEKGNVTYSQWGRLQLIQGYDIEATNRLQAPFTYLGALAIPDAREDRRFEPLIGILTYRPHNRINLDSEVRWDHEGGEVVLTDNLLEYSMPRAGGKFDRYSLEYLYIRDRSESIGVNAHVNLNEQIAAGASLHRTLDFDHNVGTRFYVQYGSQCWSIRLSVGSITGIDSVSISINLLGLGQFGTW